MKISLVIILAVVHVSIFAQNLPEKIDHYLRQTNTRNKFNGTALVVYQDKILLYRGYGFKNAARKILNDTATIFRIGSISKSFTAAVILHLAENNRLNIDDLLEKYIRDYPDGNKISIRDLLNHTSGIPEYLFAKGYDHEDFTKPISIDRLISFFKNGKLLFPPGQKFSYSNSNYTLLAYIIEKITGKKYEDVVRTMIFQPLQMDHSGLNFRNLADTNKATGYKNIYKKKSESPAVSDSTHEIGSGSIYATVMDLYRWQQSFSSNNILMTTSIHAAFTPNLFHYGFGWFIDTAYGKLNIFHGGGIPGFVAHIQQFPGDKLYIILLSNNSYCDLAEMGNKIAAIVFDMPFENAIY